jgi:hypothetical protein
MFNLADMSDNDWGVEFYRNNSQSVTGEGDAQRVFATVLTAIGQFIKKQKPNTLFFTAVKEEDPTGSRTKLYDRLVQRYATGLGYNLQKVEYPEQTGYKLTRKEQGISEDKDYMAGHCHVMAVALKQLHPDWQIRAHVGWDEEAEDDSDYRIDHVYIVAPDGTAYDCRGRFDNEQELVGPDETGGVETQFVDYSMADLKADVARGELRPFSRDDLANAVKFAQSIESVNENFADGKVKGKSRPGRVKRSGASCSGSVTDLRAKAKRYGGERGRMYHWCANMKSGRKK